MNILKKTIKTNRLLLRPFQLSDGNDVQRLAGEFEIADTTLFIPHPYEDGVAEQWIRTHEEHLKSGKEIIFAITLQNTKELIGSIGLIVNKEHEKAELGYWIGKPYWNKGYATEAAEAMLKFGFEDINLNRIHAHYFARNPASGKVMEKLGMRYEGTLRDDIKKWGKFEDIKIYGILKSEYHSKYADIN
ncbi:MAG: GNAT family N-acetyltransferase [Calditrichaceae bacterium]|nr:GNAT family N-acetyltransferase [Calditrichaceae bacterium]